MALVVLGIETAPGPAPGSPVPGVAGDPRRSPEGTGVLDMTAGAEHPLSTALATRAMSPNARAVPAVRPPLSVPKAASSRLRAGANHES